MLPNDINKPNEINNYFLQFSNYTRPDQKIINSYTSSLKTDFKNKINFTLVDENVVNKYLIEIKSKALSWDQLNIDMLLISCPYIVPFLVHILNTCLLENVFPDQWKVSKVIPLPKKNDVTSYNDLRPISILSPLSKLLEKVMAAQVRDHLTQYNILPDRQSGFRQGYSCATCLLDIIDEIIKEADSGKCTSLLLLDYSKAFDKINHEILFAILYHIGFSENAVKLITNYLKDRQQFVETSIGASERGRIFCGVPQGSVLGPLLFCIYTFNVVNSLKYCTAFLYADDSQLLYSFEPSYLFNANMHIDNDLNSLIEYSNQHQLSINSAKTQVLIFGKNKNNIASSIKLSVNNVELKCATSARPGIGDRY